MVTQGYRFPQNELLQTHVLKKHENTISEEMAIGNAAIGGCNASHLIDFMVVPV
jgi:hypothetical protein